MAVATFTTRVTTFTKQETSATTQVLTFTKQETSTTTEVSTFTSSHATFTKLTPQNTKLVLVF